MNKEIKKRWVEALRSGEYKQGAGKLRDADNTFCCLGVLCNLHAQEHPDIAKEQNIGTVYMGRSTLLPREVAEWAEFGRKEKAATPTGADVCTFRGRLSRLNDDGHSFTDIADIIEEYL
ncbi:hypothetical protein [Microcystis sp. M42BS1]|uniref:hypothetical protein n=1 Tax=Microcystis sp. M42BS1 TaxID=2771192 RepID=UPI00258C4BBE|nr:hypothetical protein [Microcystis sp. M42BS1]MCA2570674.1 hypothetical protein [Microcystis sp. M42BS1]